MSGDRWKVIKGLFQRTIELPPEEWSDYLDAVCAGDPELRGQVVSLLAEHVPYDGALRARLAGEAATIRAPRVTRSDRVPGPSGPPEEPADEH